MSNNKSFIFCTKQKGLATLPTVLALSLLIVAVGIAITSVTFSETFVAQGSAQSSKALLFAEAGGRDALIRIARNKAYSCSTTDCYSIDFITNGCSTDAGCARISVSAGTGTSLDPKIITSKGTVKSNSRTIFVSVVYDTSLNGEITTSTWTEASD